MESVRLKYFMVERQEHDLRLDIFLSLRDPSISRARVQKMIEQGAVHVENRPAKASYRVSAGETITCTIAPPLAYDVAPEAVPLDVIYEDTSLLVVDKPPGMVVHPAAGHPQGTLVNAVLHRCRELAGIGGVLRPGIVHRLDKDTSGLIVIAKTDSAHQSLTDQFRRREVEKAYLALVYGDFKQDQGSVELSVGRHPHDRKKMSTQSRRGRHALTRWQVRERYGAATLLEVGIETGRTHQIRVHLHALGHPVVGDAVYGGARRRNAVGEPSLRAALNKMERQALHAARLCFGHPLTGVRLAFSSSLPDDIAQVCDTLRKLTNKKNI